jgi:hypothetical protein
MAMKPAKTFLLSNFPPRLKLFLFYSIQQLTVFGICPCAVMRSKTSPVDQHRDSHENIFGNLSLIKAEFSTVRLASARLVAIRKCRIADAKN